jgi:hypothetical protein
MPAADFCLAIKGCSPFSPDSGTRRRPPEVSSTAFNAQPPDLPPAALMDVGFAAFGPLARCRRPLPPVLVHRLAPLLHASFRPRLTTTPLRFAITSPPSGCEEDFHLQAVEHARHTKKAALVGCLLSLQPTNLTRASESLCARADDAPVASSPAFPPSSAACHPSSSS